MGKKRAPGKDIKVWSGTGEAVARRRLAGSRSEILKILPREVVKVGSPGDYHRRSPKVVWYSGCVRLEGEVGKARGSRS